MQGGAFDGNGMYAEDKVLIFWFCASCLKPKVPSVLVQGSDLGFTLN